MGRSGFSKPRTADGFPEVNRKTEIEDTWCGRMIGHLVVSLCLVPSPRLYVRQEANSLSGAGLQSCRLCCEIIFSVSISKPYFDIYIL